MPLTRGVLRLRLATCLHNRSKTYLGLDPEDLLPKGEDDGDDDDAAAAAAASMQEEPAVLPAPPKLADGPAAKCAAVVRALLDSKLGRGVTETVESDEVLLAGVAALVLLLLAVLIRMLI